VPPPAEPAIGQFGVSGKVVARDKTTFTVGEKAFFIEEATNHSDKNVFFTFLGLKADGIPFHTSWDNNKIAPGETFRWEDGITFDVPGTYNVFLAICYGDCENGGVWEEYRDGAATITVQ